LLALGFEPLGVHWEKVVFHRRSEEQAFVHRKERCFAGAFRLFKGDPLVSFLTHFESGAIVHTTTCNTYPTAEESDYRGTQVPATILAPIFEEHQRITELFQKGGNVPCPCNSLEGYAAVQRAHFYHPVLRGMFQRQNRSSAVEALASALSVLMGILFLLVAVNQPYLAWGIGGFYIVTTWIQLRRGIGSARQKQRAEQERGDAAWRAKLAAEAESIPWVLPAPVVSIQTKNPR
jgi:hypothetical protein